MASHRHRAAKRGERPARAPRGRRWTVFAVMLLAAGLALGAGTVWSVRRVLADDSPSSSGIPGTVLAELTVGEGLIASAVLALGPSGATCVLVPAALQVGSVQGTVALSRTLAGGGPSASAVALSRTLGLRIDGTWRLSGLGLARLVDAAGGVVADVPRAVRSGQVVVAAGTGQRLSGAQTSAFVAVSLPGEGPQVVLQRFGLVLGQVLSGLGTSAQSGTGGAEGDAGVDARQLEALGPESATTLPVARLAAFLARLTPSVDRQGLRTEVIPIQTGPAAPAGSGRGTGVALDEARAGELLRRELPAAVLSQAPVSRPAGSGSAATSNVRP